MEVLSNLPVYLLSFLAVLTAVIFVHELGHYWVARWNGVRVEVFSIGFGPELYGWNNRHGTRWKISAIPLGGYVKFFGDASAASTPADIDALTPAERAVTFHHKRLPQRAAIVAAGPFANFLFAIVIFALLFSVIGQPFTPPVVGAVVAGSPAENAGFQTGDRILSVDGTAIERFEELRSYVAMRAETSLRVTVLRDKAERNLIVVPARVEVPDGFGGTQRIGQIGIQTQGIEFVRHGPVAAVWYATRETGALVVGTLNYVGRMLAGRESGDQLSGPLGIAKISGDAARLSLGALVMLAATISVAIGLMNLFPIPMLDGGHLLFYAIEALRGRPLGVKAQEFGFRIGLALVLTLFLFATWNDLNRLQVFNLIANLFS